MKRYLLVIDIDRPVMDEELDRTPISYLAARQEQEPIEVVVMSVATQPRLPTTGLLLGGAVSAMAPIKAPFAPPPDLSISAAAEHRLSLVVRHLKTVGCQASGIVSDEGLAEAVGSEARGHNYDEVILATSRQADTWLRRLLRRDPIHRLRRHWGKRLIVFPLGWPAGSSSSA